MLKKISILFVLSLSFANLGSAASLKDSVTFRQDSIVKSFKKLSAKDYIQVYKDIAVEEMKKYGIPASITLAQGLLESSNGNSTLARLANNHFGIKCPGGWTGDSVFQNDDAPNECFRSYLSAENSYSDHSLFLTKNKRYAFLFQYSVNDYVSWANGLKQAGYATNPQYPMLLISLIDRYQLYQFDEGGRRMTTEDPFFSDEELEAIINMILPMPQNSAATFYKVKLGDTLFSIAQRFKIAPEELVSINKLKSNAIRVGQELKVSQE